MFGHDLWIETNVATLLPRDCVQVAFKLGNCEHGKQTFRTADLIDRDGVTAFEMQPDGRRILISKQLVPSSDVGGGFWHMERELSQPGVTWFCHTLDQTVRHGGTDMRGVVSAKAFVWVREDGNASGRPPSLKKMGLPLELILQSSAVPSAEQAEPIRVQLLLHDKPLPNTPVSFLPNARDWKSEDPKQYDRITDSDGIADFKARHPGLFLITARHVGPNDDPSGPSEVYYSTSLTLRVGRAMTK
ncbi:MAG: DUF4198 domain-containing protein [Pirellulales bacterium]